jgi:transposase-like protein
MTFHVFLLLLLFFLMFALMRLCPLCWPHHCPTHSAATAKRTPIQRLLKPRSPHDCPACRLSCTISSGVGPTSVRPWREVKSRRGAPKRVNTDGFACPNHQCPYSGITDAHVHALVGDGTHGRAEQIQTFRCQACYSTFTARRHTPLYRLKTPSRQVAVVLTARACGLDPSAAERVFGYRQATITSLSDSCWRACSDFTRALLQQSLAPTHPVGRTAHEATQHQTGALALAGNRPPHEDSSRTPTGTPHAKRGASGYPLSATTLGPRLPADLHQ